MAPRYQLLPLSRRHDSCGSTGFQEILKGKWKLKDFEVKKEKRKERMMRINFVAKKKGVGCGLQPCKCHTSTIEKLGDSRVVALRQDFYISAKPEPSAKCQMPNANSRGSSAMIHMPLNDPTSISKRSCITTICNLQHAFHIVQVSTSQGSRVCMFQLLNRVSQWPLHMPVSSSLNSELANLLCAVLQLQYWSRGCM